MILDSDHRIAQARIDLVETHDEVVLNAGQLVHDVTDGIVDDRGLGQLGGRVLIKLGQVLEDHRAGVAEESENGGDREQKDRDEPDDHDPHVAPRPVALLPLHGLTSVAGGDSS